MKEGVREDSFTFGYDEDSTEPSLAFVFGFNVQNSLEAAQEDQLSAIYYQEPEVENVQPGVFSKRSTLKRLSGASSSDQRQRLDR